MTANAVGLLPKSVNLLALQQGDVLQGHAEYGVHGGRQEVGQGVGVLGYLVELSGALQGVLEVAAGKGIEGLGEFMEGDGGDGGEVWVIGEDVRIYGMDL